MEETSNEFEVCPRCGKLPIFTYDNVSNSYELSCRQCNRIVPGIKSVKQAVNYWNNHYIQFTLREMEEEKKEHSKSRRKINKKEEE